MLLIHCQEHIYVMESEINSDTDVTNRSLVAETPISNRMMEVRERELYSPLNRNKKNLTIQTFTSLAGYQKGHNTHRAGHLKKKQIESKIK